MPSNILESITPSLMEDLKINLTKTVNNLLKKTAEEETFILSDSLDEMLKSFIEEISTKAEEDLYYVIGDFFHIKIRDSKTAIKWYEKAAIKGSVKAMFAIGVAYDTLEDISNAMKWYKKAAIKGCIKSQTNLGLCYLDETNEPEKAFKYLIKSAKHKDVFALSALGKMYKDGLWVQQDFTKALKYYKKAAELGYCKGQFATGHLYNSEFKDDDTAIYWFTKAANNTTLLIGETKINTNENKKYRDLAQLNLDIINRTLLSNSDSIVSTTLEERTSLVMKLLGTE